MVTRINKLKKYASLQLEMGGDRLHLYTHVKTKDLTSFQNSMRKLISAHQTVPRKLIIYLCVDCGASMS